MRRRAARGISAAGAGRSGARRGRRASSSRSSRPRSRRRPATRRPTATPPRATRPPAPGLSAATAATAATAPAARLAAGLHPARRLLLAAAAAAAGQQPGRRRFRALDVSAGLWFFSAGLSSIVSIICAVIGIVYAATESEGGVGGEPPSTRTWPRRRDRGRVMVGLATLSTIAWTSCLILAATSESFVEDLSNELDESRCRGSAPGRVRHGSARAAARSVDRREGAAVALRRHGAAWR